MGGFAVRITSPLEFLTHPVASTMRSGALVVGLVVTDGLLRLSLFGLRVIKSTSTASGVNISEGLGGKPPRPVITKELRLCLLPGLQPVSICCEISTRFTGNSTNPRLTSTSGMIS